MYLNRSTLPRVSGFSCCRFLCFCLQNILGLQGVPHEFFLEVYYTFSKIPEARTGDVVLGLLCLAVLIMLLFMKESLGAEGAPTCPTVARKLVWTVATGQYLCGCDHVGVRQQWQCFTMKLRKLNSPSCIYDCTFFEWNCILVSDICIFLSVSSLRSVRNALVVVASSFVAFSWNAYGHPVFTVTGETSRGLPPFRPPPTSDTTANGTVVSFGEIVEVRSSGTMLLSLL